MGITFGGIATGLPPNLVEQLVQAERIPIAKMERQRGKSENRLKLVSELETKISEVTKSLSELASTRGFADMQLISSDPNVIAGTVDPNTAVNGTWSLEVMELAHKPAAITNGFPDKDKTQIGVGYFKFETANGQKQVFINSSNNTLEGAANAINNARLGLRASVLNDRADRENPFKLVIAGNELGADNTVDYPTLYFLDGDQDLYFNESRGAKNGKVKIDGFEIEIPDNTMNDLVPGVTLDLKNAAPGRAVTITVKENNEVVSGKIKTFVDSMNAVLSFIQGQNRLNEKSDTSTTLGGDSLLRSIEQRLRSLIQNPQFGVGGGVNRLNELGITFTREGLLDLNQKKFDAALARDPVSVQKFFAGDGFSTGFIPSLKREVSNLLNQAFGPLTNRKRGLQQKIDQTNTQIENKERQLSRREEQLRRQFSKLEETMSRLKGQGAAVQGFAATPLAQASGPAPQG